MLKSIAEFKKYKERLTEEVKTYCQDLSIPLEKRWEIFCVSELGDTEGSIEHFRSLDAMFGGECSLYDDLNKDKYATVNLVDIIDYQLEEATFNPDVDEESTEEEWLASPKESWETCITRAQLNALKEEILSKFRLSFVNDW